MKFILFDIIGMKSGCKYYDVAFYKQLLNHGFAAEIHSNFSIDESKPAIINIYEGTKISKILNLIKLFPQFIGDVISNRNNRFVYLTYGEIVDCILIFILILLHPKPILDVHEFISLDKKNNRLYCLFFKFLYRHIYAVIYHSQRSENYLEKINYSGKRLYVPHFKYEFPQNYKLENLSNEIIHSYHPNKINILFFGHMRKSKGINVVLDSINNTTQDILHKLHFIFAGDDSHGIVMNKMQDITSKASVFTILRVIKDEELNFLFKKADLILLPYEEVSQSGILETAVYFRKPMVLSDITYFSNFTSQFPSFAYLIRQNDSFMLSNIYNEIYKNGVKHYKENEIEKFYEKEKYDIFFNNLNLL